MSIKLKGSTDGSVTLDAPSDTSPSGSDITLTLPTTVGSAEQFLKNSGTAGELEYSSMVETSTGIGIGTSAPGLKLHVQDGALASAPTPNSNCDVVIEGTTNTGIQFLSSGQTQLRFGDAASTGAGSIIYNHSSDDLRLSTSGSERLRITSTGNVAIGTTGPFGGNVTNRRHFTLNGTDSAMFQWGVNGTDRGYLYADATNLSIINTQNGYLRFNTNDTERFRIAANGRVTAQVIYGTPLSGTTRDVYIEDGGQLGYISSVRDSKTNINLLSNVDWLYQLQPSSFNYKLTDQEGAYTGEVNPELEYGLIAEDVEPVAPELCFYDEVDGEQELRGVHYKKLIVPMLKALQEANAKIESLETQNTAQQAQIDDLLARVTALEAA